jgi:hypothetical protein
MAEKKKTATKPDTITAAGKVWTFRLGFDQLAEMEVREDRGLQEIVNRLGTSPSIRGLRLFLEVGLIDADGNRATQADAGAVMSEIGLEASGELIVEALKSVFVANDG